MLTAEIKVNSEVLGHVEVRRESVTETDGWHLYRYQHLVPTVGGFRVATEGALWHHEEKGPMTLLIRAMERIAQTCPGTPS